MSEANDHLNKPGADVVQAVFEKITKKKNSDYKAVVPPAKSHASDPKSRLLDNLYKQHWHDLCGWLYRRYGAGPPEPEDIAQAAFEKMITLENLDYIQNPRAFLFTVAARVALMKLRKRNRTRDFITHELQGYGIEIEEITPERIYSSKERFEKLGHVLDTLSPKQREIIIRSRIHGQTYEEISRETGWSIGSISGHVKDAMLTLKSSDQDDRENNT